jgi:hypothetical protein
MNHPPALPCVTRFPALQPVDSRDRLLGTAAERSRRLVVRLVATAISVVTQVPVAAACAGGAEYESITVKVEPEASCLVFVETGTACIGNGHILAENNCDTRAWIVGWNAEAVAVEPNGQTALHLGQKMASGWPDVALMVCSGPTPPPANAVPPALPASEDQRNEAPAGKLVFPGAKRPLPCVGPDSAPPGSADFVLSIQEWRESGCGTCLIGAYQPSRNEPEPDWTEGQESGTPEGVEPMGNTGCASRSLGPSSHRAVYIAAVVLLLLRVRRRLSQGL